MEYWNAAGWTRQEIEGANAEILYRVGAFLNGNPAWIQEEEVRCLVEDCGVVEGEAYRLLLAAAMGLDVAGRSRDRALYAAYFPGMVRRLEPRIYQEDSYLRHVRIVPAREGRWEWDWRCYAPYEAFVRDDFAVLPDGRVFPRLGYFSQEFRYPAVLEDGREWMLITPNEMETMRPAIRAAQGKVLTLGLGMGYYAYHVCEKETVHSLTVVERDPAAIALFTRYILPQFPHGEKLRLVEGDAFAYVREHLAEGGFDVVFTDLWHDVSDGLPLYRRMKALEGLSPGSRFLYWIEPTLRCYEGKDAP